jgi:hypothetical protein
MDDTSDSALATSGIACVECERAWDAPTERWHMKVLFVEKPPVMVAYCPDCHAREFGVD